MSVGVSLEKAVLSNAVEGSDTSLPDFDAPWSRLFSSSSFEVAAAQFIGGSMLRNGQLGVRSVDCCGNWSSLLSLGDRCPLAQPRWCYSL